MVEAIVRRTVELDAPVTDRLPDLELIVLARVGASTWA